MGVQASVDIRQFISIIERVSFGVFWWFLGYIGIQEGPARVIALKSTYGSCKAQMSKLRPKETRRSD